jgi:hypothetical protein
MKLTADRPFAKPEAAARKLLEIVRSNGIDVEQHTSTSVTLTAFLHAGGSVAEYAVGRDYGIAQRWFAIDRSGTKIILKQAGADM